MLVQTMNNDFTDRVAIVTGSSRGIGRAIAETLAANGAQVVVNYANDLEGAEETVDAIVSKGNVASLFQADVSVLSQAEDLINYALDKYGTLDILVNNAGTTRDQLIMRMSEEDWDLVLRVNLKSIFNCCRIAVKPMMRKRYGRIVNISSVSGIAGNAGQTNYAASKSGAIGFSRSLARETASRKITVNVVAPGFIPTSLTNNLSDDLKEQTLAHIPLGRWGEPEEVAEAVVFLAGETAGYITGQVINVDGGMVMA
jgi:3-oxoacyl-[acyl-carrier protein] reductase